MEYQPDPTVRVTKADDKHLPHNFKAKIPYMRAVRRRFAQHLKFLMYEYRDFINDQSYDFDKPTRLRFMNEHTRLRTNVRKAATARTLWDLLKLDLTEDEEKVLERIIKEENKKLMNKLNKLNIGIKQFDFANPPGT